jgi:hypothetical protein
MSQTLKAAATLENGSWIVRRCPICGSAELSPQGLRYLIEERGMDVDTFYRELIELVAEGEIVLALVPLSEAEKRGLRR